MSKKVIYLQCTKDQWSEAYTKATKEKKSNYHPTEMAPTGSIYITSTKYN
jgi:hypothetical protein